MLAFSQNAAQASANPDVKIVFDGGLMLGHSESYYPAPFSTSISFLYQFNKYLLFGAGSGADIIGRTFIPVYADIRAIPFKTKPFFLYEKAGWTFCANKNYTDGNDLYYSRVEYPHPLDENITTKGGIMNEFGLGVLLKRPDWTTSISVGYRYMKTSDQTAENKKTYENNFNRMVIRLGFWF